MKAKKENKTQVLYVNFKTKVLTKVVVIDNVSQSVEVIKLNKKLKKKVA